MARTPTVTALGMATSLGHDAVTAAAAARAGIVRAGPLPVWLPNADTQDPEPVVGHAVDGLADGFEGTGRLLRLAELALADLLHQTPASDLRSAHWLVALPETLPPAPPPGLLDADAPAVEPGDPPPRLDPERLRALIGRMTGSPVAPQRFTGFAGRVGWVRAMGHAARLAESGTLCVVGVTDSLVDPTMLHTLHAHGRLKGPGGSVGLIPGEAAVWFAIGPDGRGDAQARVGQGALGVEPAHQYSGRPPLGRVLADVVTRTGAGADAWPVTDCNGEPFRSGDWGHAVVRSDALRASVGAAWYPATSVGDTGAASVAVGAAFAIRGFARGYAPAPAALLLAADATAPRGALALLAP